MKFRTEIDIKPFDERIDYQSRIFAIGSCFADVVGGKLQRSKFVAEVNPVGVLFNPASIARTLDRLANRQFITPDEIRQSAGGWFHYDLHSSLSGEDKELTLNAMNSAIERGHSALIDADWVIITLGTAWIYELTESGEVVANCHKQPHSNFRRRRLSVAQTVAALQPLLNGVLSTKKVILTLSPIRHIADGLAENSLSKATLRVAIEEIISTNPSRVRYFPAYEIFMDDLRDYRFYGEDMVHPSPVAIDYVWERFLNTAISPEAMELMGKILRIVKASEHRPSNPQSQSHKKFCQEQLRLIDQIPEGVDLSKERGCFREDE